MTGQGGTLWGVHVQFVDASVDPPVGMSSSRECWSCAAHCPVQFGTAAVQQSVHPNAQPASAPALSLRTAAAAAAGSTQFRGHGFSAACSSCRALLVAAAGIGVGHINGLPMACTGNTAGRAHRSERLAFDWLDTVDAVARRLGGVPSGWGHPFHSGGAGAMTLAEVMVSALILSISAQTSLQGWGRSSAAVTAADALQVQSRELEVFRLASLRLLQDADPAVLLSQDDASCRFEPQALRQLLELNLPPSMAERVQLQQASDAEGLWLNLSAPPATRTPNNPLQRRTLLTPAGLGLCALTP